MDERHIVDAFRKMRQQPANPFAAFAMLFPIPRALHHCAWVALEKLYFAARIELLAVPLDQLRLVIKGVALAGCAGHEELDDPLSFARLSSEQALLTQDVSQCDAAKAATIFP